ncbi:MAG: 4-hydroxy-tetrahydrodipicolinate reductase [Candidatus Lokiarchaeota archaeon]|nr:4-hydroxy-tetrahydrodipicolinate reductase [Candidatus Lokiarchaeota archaeon]
MIKICICGADGNMGGLVAKKVIEDPDLELVAAITMSSSPNLGKDIGTVVSQGPIGVILRSSDELDDILLTPIDFFIDFTIAKAVEQNISKVLDRNINCIIGTTGMSQDFKKEFEKIIKEKNLSGMISPNMSIGVNIFFQTVRNLARILKDYDIEIIEKHHHRKRDSPSGTAAKTAAIIAEALGKDLKKVGKYGRVGDSPRKIGSEEIGIHAVRAGDIVGDHTVLFAGPGERIEITHMAHSRECLANGTIQAIKFMYDKGPGIWNMEDLI